MTTFVGRYPGGSSCSTEPSVVTLGSFDGLHLGHQSLLNEVRNCKHNSGLTSVVLSFYPHPSVALAKTSNLPLLTTIRQKLAFLSSFQVDLLYLVHFSSRLASMSAQRFCEEVLVQRLNTHELIIGEDARVGHNREGDSEFLLQFMQKLGRKCRVLKLLKSDDTIIGSRVIRTLVMEGHVERAALLLGRPYTIDSLIQHGAARGRQIGFPTANLKLNIQCKPKAGVYACYSYIDGQAHPCVTNVGVRPTFGGTSVQIETHIFNKQLPSLYGKRIQLSFISRIRDEMKFPSVERLKQQIALDIAVARELLK